MIRRALQSLIAQDCQNWVCEVHNDWPDDAATIQDIVDSLGDQRFEVFHHRVNLGGTRSFNLAFESQHEEPFFSILEDDNFWHSNFLSRMLASMANFPAVAVAWCNQQVQFEASDGSFSDSDILVGPTGDAPRLIEFGDVKQALGNLHADGATIVRTAMNRGFAVPTDLPFSGIEIFRERAFPFPLLYEPAPLAVFTVTRQTGRTDSAYEWFLLLSLAGGSFLKYCEKSVLLDAFAYYRSMVPNSTNPLLAGLLMNGCLRLVLQNTKPMDWVRLFKAIARRPAFAQVFFQRSKFKAWQDFIDKNTQQRFL
jgi:hypothetical protein